MARFYKVRNLGPAPSVEELAMMLTAYSTTYADYHELKDIADDRTVDEYVYDQSMQMIAGDPRSVLTFVSNELMEFRDDPIDEGQVPMLERIGNAAKAYIAVRGL